MARKSKYAIPEVTEVAALLVPAPFNRPWFFEAPVRHAVRVLLCLQGMKWQRADWLGHSLVARARIENGTRQPAGWDTDNELAQWLPDAECPICDRWFKRRWLEQYYCTSACSKRGAEIRWWCEQRVGAVGPPQCRFCNGYFEAELPQQKYCCRSCQDKATKLDQGERADVELGKSIANARRNARWTQAELARLAGINERYLGSIEEGKAVMSEGLRDILLGLLAPYDRPGRHCAWCEQPIPPEKDPRATHCSRECTIAHGNDRLKQRKWANVPAGGNGHAQPNGHDHAPNGSAGPGAAPGAPERAPANGIAAPGGAGAHRTPTAG